MSSEAQSRVAQLEEEIARLKQTVAQSEDNESKDESQSLRKRSTIKKSPEPNETEQIRTDNNNSSNNNNNGNDTTDARDVVFVLVRSVLVLVIFIFLHSLYTQYIFNPIFRKEPQIDYDSITSQLCPQGVEGCSYQLKENWKELVRNRAG